jgi:L-aspartate oxidase
VGLDLRPVDMSRFPNIASALRRAGVDPAAGPVPVAPAAHYMMGGIATDLDGRSSIPGLYAVGECACTGLHGANRIASNSLAECFVFAHRAVLAAAGEPAPPSDPGSAPDAAPSPVPPAPSRSALWRLAGLERTPDGLAELAEDPFPLARLIARSALARTESRGAHQRTDFPAEDPAFDGMHTVVAGDAPPGLERWI